ncbi:valine--tRNA ligase [Lutimaribacter sp. EGI FJ00015]|uniref:Valine--tRNA ligase n=1 Tax=Lutimaribacter degradans TaxID=2945989 RepID=A0ACC5ZWV6_9RHOB|nr:valine--tRNA ligase [Lutimaribacter sp. EGI FJ00013]MCM2562340.1 valine--tRNA ligase [Lutimaribacter sp. EGI FJ00013]MCO0613495.1 valine--tRNA ligase [Lutimaribacter sp. EGI FJ00015]MCO0636469.1 valine--tRNA ligase [Lutimaribacter sp. EGI FJ00014]
MGMDKTFDAAEAEPRLYDAWMQAGAFRAGANASRDETFTVMIPPPNVTGALHVGHAFNNTLQDILVRWHRMRGFDTLWQPGQDHAGIATQLQVEKQLAAQGEPGRRELGREKFLGKVWEWKAQYGGTIVQQLQRLGCSCDWDRNAFTMAGAPGDPRTGHENSPDFHDAVIKVFVDMFEKGLIYRGKRLVNWDPHFETAISDLEVENIEVDGHMWHFKYPLAGGETYTYVERDEDGAVLFEETRDYISIATTRPETMLGDGAVAVHPKDERYAPIVGKLCEIPVGPKEHRRLVPIITDDYPDPDFGSGAVKITGAHDFNDYAVAKRGGIPCYRLMDTRGHMRDDGAPYTEAAEVAQAVARGEKTLTEAETDALNLVPDHLRGLDRFEARNRVIDEITAEGLAVMTESTDARLGKAAEKAPVEPSEGGEMRTEDQNLVPLVEEKKIMQPFGDRSGVVIEPMLTDQWFVDAQKVVGPALEAVRDGRTTIMPESGEKTYYHWLENIEPWCISRQLWWGHQIPVWYLPGEEEWLPICAATEAEAIEIARNRFVDGTDIRIVADAQEAVAVLQNRIDHADTGDEGAIRQFEAPQEIPMFRDPDVLDTWFSSGLWPIGTLGWPDQTEELKKYFPTDVLVTGFDILFFWVARMMMMQLAVVNEVPFHTVYLHQLVRDEKGQKMSKTKGNVIDPLDIVDEYGADALRFTMAQMAALGGVLKLSKDRIKGYRNFGTKLWNACRFAEMNGVWEGHATQDTPPEATATVNRWIIGETARVRETVDTALEEYRFNDAANALYSFVWGRVCDWYIEFAKPLLAEDAPERAETQAVMAWVLDQCMIFLHPIMPYITEELWGQTGTRPKMLVHADWPGYGADLADRAADREMGWIIGLIEEVRSVRAQMHVPAGAYVPLLVTGLGDEARAAWGRNEVLARRLARIESLQEVAEFPKGTATIPMEGGTFGLPLAGIIDVAEEKARLEKTLAKLAKDLGGLRGRLNNPKFVESAPDEVVIETRETLSVKEDEEAQIKAAVARLAELG